MWDVLPFVVSKSCYWVQGEGKTEEYKITNTKNCHNNASKQKEPAKKKYNNKRVEFIITLINICHVGIFLTTLTSSGSVLTRAGCCVPGSRKWVVVLLNKLTWKKEIEWQCAQNEVPCFKCFKLLNIEWLSKSSFSPGINRQTH